MAAPERRRRQILIDRQLQLGLSVHFVAWLYFYVVAFAVLANAESIWALFTQPDSEGAHLEAVEHLQWFTKLTILPLTLTFACVAVHGVMITHRIAGPIYRIKAVIRDLAQRRLPSGPVTLRKGDCFRDVAEELTKLTDSTRDDHARRRRMNGETVAALRELVDSLESGPRPAAETLAMANQALDRAEFLDRHLSAALEPVADDAAAPAADATPPAGTAATPPAAAAPVADAAPPADAAPVAADAPAAEAAPAAGAPADATLVTSDAAKS
jgi:hypothetical protein